MSAKYLLDYFQSMNDSTNGTDGNGTGFVMPRFTGSWYLPADIPNLIVLTIIAVLGMANLGLILCFVQAKFLRKPFNYILLGKYWLVLFHGSKQRVNCMIRRYNINLTALPK